MTRPVVLPTLIAEIKVTYSCKVPNAERPKISASQDAVDILRLKWDNGLMEYIEEFKVILLNRANKVLGIQSVSKGGLSGTVADPKVIFATALKANASSIILVHNHPSGNLNPSEADMKLTRKLKEAGTFLDLPVLDHVIITKESHFSFAEEGLL